MVLIIDPFNKTKAGILDKQKKIHIRLELFPHSFLRTWTANVNQKKLKSCPSSRPLDPRFKQCFAFHFPLQSEPVDRHRGLCPAGGYQTLMRSIAVVKRKPACKALLHFSMFLLTLKSTFSYFSDRHGRSPNTLSNSRTQSCMLITTSASSSLLVKARAVNCEPWSVLIFSKRSPFRVAANASRRKRPSREFSSLQPVRPTSATSTGCSIRSGSGFAWPAR